MNEWHQTCFPVIWASLVVQIVKNLPTVRETQVQSLGQEDALEKRMATHSNILAWRTPWTEETGGLQFSSVAQSCLTLCDPMDCRTPGFPVHHQLKLMSIASVMPSNHLVLDHPLLLLPSLFPSIRVFSKESALCIR